MQQTAKPQNDSKIFSIYAQLPRNTHVFKWAVWEKKEINGESVGSMKKMLM